MDGAHFDAIVRTMSSRLTRRRLARRLGVMAAVAGGGVSARAVTGSALAASSRSRRPSAKDRVPGRLGPASSPSAPTRPGR
jgi:hypothetical protein